jgi:SRSO17 transposase
LKGFSKHFICHTTDNLSKCSQFLSGLLHECKSNIERMVERVPNSNYDQLQHFISNSPWDSFAVMATVAEKVAQTLRSSVSGASTVSSTGLLLDESGWEKSGKKSVGVTRQYIGQVGKIANGQVAVFAALSNGDQVGLLQGRLYLPNDWVKDKERCTQAGIPKDDQVYRTKPELAIEILKTLPTSITYDWVGGDCIYGNSLTLRQYLYDKKQVFVMDVGEELGVYLQRPQLAIPPKKEGRGRTPTAYASDIKPVLLKDLIHQIPEEQWQIITHRHGTKGPLTRKATIIDVHIWKSERGTNIESLQLIISTETDGSEIKYSLCYNIEGKMSLETALFRQMQRYWVERAFQNVKEQLGLHQYQVRSWKAWHHHIALTLMALHFILEVQKEYKEEMPLLSVPDIKLVFAKKLSNNLNSDEGLIHALNVRHKQRYDDIQKHSRVPK